MAFARPTLPELITRIEADMVSRLTGGGTLLRRSVVKVLSRVISAELRQCRSGERHASTPCGLDLPLGLKPEGRRFVILRAGDGDFKLQTPVAIIAGRSIH